ncbi:potassium transporter 6 isoform X2 [Populus alba x Populus x berolinensis]|uniref:Potassium transporter 6 isoform X2 n=1 Tax=Populus alba x Populus x berolinensis TaxID=444605 RepID=A0AAD6M1E6_9ROSI|nr:potassium transporter 6 isoform X2 [Populus alba x Populus x berolinensis]
MDHPPSPTTSSDRLKETWSHALVLSFQTLGVVCGRLSTAPLYVFGTIQTKDFKSNEIAYEYFSFILWTLTVVSLLKYAFIVLRADDNGEGGVFALYSLLRRHAKVGLIPNDTSTNEVMQHEEESTFRGKVESRARRAIKNHGRSHYLMLFTALFGACMIIGDGVITPSISVLSASSGLQRSLSEIKYSSSPDAQGAISDALKKYVPVPSACVITVCLFILQHYGTHKIGFMFAPIVTIWLLFIGGVGIYNIFHWNPEIFSALSPVYMYRFVRNINKDRWKSLGSILLCIAGSETMFTDLGHFSKRSIKNIFVMCSYCYLFLLRPYGNCFWDDSNNLYDVPCDGSVLGEEFVHIRILFDVHISFFLTFHHKSSCISSGADLRVLQAQPVPCVPPSQRCCVGRVGGKDYRIYRCIVRYGDCESLTSPEGRTVIVGTPLLEGHALIPVDDTNLVSGSTNAANNETMAIPVGDLIGRNAHVRRKKVRFLIPESSPRLRVSLSGMSYKN